MCCWVFKEVTREGFARGFDAGDISAMENCCHKIPVEVGDTYFICGTPHAIGGGGCFVRRCRNLPISLWGQETEGGLARKNSFATGSGFWAAIITMGRITKRT